jgi:hypothetical protein
MLTIHRPIAPLTLATAFLAAACAYGTMPVDPVTADEQHQTEAPAAGDAGSDPAPRPASDAATATPDSSTPPPVDAGTTAPDTGPVTCTKTLTIPSVSLSNKVCTDINTQVTKANAVTLTYPCAGGVATATFGQQPFTGSVTGGKLLITNVMPFDLQSCHLESTQTISGDVTTPALTWSYGERFLSGNCSGDIICTATAKVNVQ